MKKFKNIESFEEATNYIKRFFVVPVSEMILEEQDEAQVLSNIIWLFDNAKNAAVRAAIHRHALGDKVYLDTQEEKYVEEDIFYGNIFCEYLNQTVYYSQLKNYDGSNKTLRYATRTIAYAIDAETREETFIDKSLLVKANLY